MIRSFMLSELARFLGAELKGRDCEIRRVCTDTRALAPGDLFVALKGPNFDGHQFLDQAQASGALAAVVEQAQVSDLPQLIVDDTQRAFGRLGLYNRQLFSGPLVGITGSSGKTSVKEMLASILRQQGQTLATRGNLNNEIGVPMTLLEISADDQYAVIEMGASGGGEIAWTTSLAKPDVAVLNNAAGAHLEGFGSLEGVVKAKSEIYQGLGEQGVGIVNADDVHAHIWLDCLRYLGRSAKTFSVRGLMANASASQLKLGEQGGYRFELNLEGQCCAVQLAVLGRHNVANACAAALAAHCVGVPLVAIKAGLEAFSAVPGRLYPLAGRNNSLLIDDSYNANPGSVRAAIDLLAECRGRRGLLLGDMAELGEGAEAEHAALGEYAARAGLDYFWAVGSLSQAAVAAFAARKGAGGRHFEDKYTAIDALRDTLAADMTLLVKGSRSAGMDEVLGHLKKQEN